VNQSSKIGVGIFICFGLVFAAFGIFGAGSIFFGNPANVHGNPYVGVAVCSIFIAVGLGIVFAGIYGGRKVKQLDALKQASPDSPWLWREDWAVSRAESNNRNAAIGLWIATIFWNAISLTIAAFVVPPLLQKSDMKGLVPLGFCLIGAILFAFAVRASIRRERFGKTYFEFASLPFTPGRQFKGTIHLRFNTTAAHGITLRLSCVRRIVTQSGKNSNTSQILLWQDEKNIPADSLNTGSMGDSAIPVDFGIPSDAFESNHDHPNDQVLWLLHAQADVPGVNYSDDFEVPVFRLSPASAPVAEVSDTSFANYNSANNFASSSSAAATAPAFESDASDVAAPDNPTVVVSTGPNGGTEFYFHAFRNPGKVWLLIFFTTFWTGIVYFLHRSTAPWFFPIVFGLFDIFLIHASLQSALGTVHIEVGNGKIATRKNLLGLGNAQETPFAEIAQILAVTGPEQGTMTTNASYSIRVVTKAGKKLNLVNAIYNRQEARWIVAQMEKLAGLKLDTHVAVDAPFVAYGYGPPPQRGQAQTVLRSQQRGNRVAAAVGVLLFAAGIGFMVFRSAALPHTASHRAVPSGSKATQVRRVTYSPLTDGDEQRLRLLPPQKQAEELLERAIQHDPRALDLFEQNMGVWLGTIKLTARMKQLEQRSQYSTDLRVRQANADLNLAMDGWAKDDNSANLMIKNAENDPQSRANSVYFMGMLAGRGVAYDRIYPVLVNFAKNDQDATVRQWAVEGMRFLGTDEALDQLFEAFTTDASDSVRERAGCNLSDCGMFTRKQRMHMVPKFLSLLNDPRTSPQMRNWSFMALTEITDQNLPQNASAWSAWYTEHGAEKMAEFEQQDSWRVRGDE
jgi:HEAT repeats